MLKRGLFFYLILFCQLQLHAQSNLYFPPTTLNANWDTISPSSLGWCTQYLDTLNNFLDSSDSKGFIILKDGKIAHEKYFGSFTKDSIWYWASAGKTITSLLYGIAQEENFLTINDSSSKYLGQGFTNCSLAQEGKITLKHQLTMTSGIDDNVIDLDCTNPTCLNYIADPGTRWAYHNAMYLLLQPALEAAIGQTLQTYTNIKIKNKTGMAGFWFDGVYYSRVRDMARYGLMILNNGIWDNDTLIHDQVYFNQMITPSQSINESYGYLFWLNGQSSYMLPQSQFVFNGPIVTSSSSDMICGLGKNEQRYYVIPSQGLVIVRMGNPTGVPVFALSNYDELLWEKINQVICTSTPITENNMEKELSIWPNPAHDKVKIETNQVSKVEVYNILGNKEITIFNESYLDVSNYLNGIYFLRYNNKVQKLIVRH